MPEGGRKVAQLKVLKVQHVAYSSVSSARLEVGTRCVGLFREHPDQPGQFYSGVVAEPPKPTNRFDVRLTMHPGQLSQCDLTFSQQEPISCLL